MTTFRDERRLAASGVSGNSATTRSGVGTAQIVGDIDGGEGNDTIAVSGGSIRTFRDGDDIFSMSGGTLAGAVIGGTGNDQIAVSGGRS